jgi:hypothetical protein
MVRKRRTRSNVGRTVTWTLAVLRAGTASCHSLLRRLLDRAFPQGPVVLVDGPAARRQRRLIMTNTRILAASLGAALPDNLVIVVQRLVKDNVNGQLQVFEDSDSTKRYFLQLAQSVHGRQVSEEELVAVLRGGLLPVLEDVLGKPARSVSIELDAPRSKAGAPVVGVRANGNGPPLGELERGAIPIHRIEDRQAS